MRYLSSADSVNAAYRRRGEIVSFAMVTLVVLAGLSAVGYWAWQRNQTSTLRTDLVLAEASRGPFDHIVLEKGELESTSNVEIICQVRSRSGSQGTAILWVIDEGTHVKAGDKLVELDDSTLKTALRDKRIVVIGAEAQVAAAEAEVEQARIARQEYLEGLFETEERAIQSEMAVAEQELRKAQLALQSSERLVARGLVKSLQLEADQFAVANSRNQLEAAANRLKVLQNLTRQKMLVQFDSAIESAEANLAAAQGSLEEEQTDLRDIERQIELCTMYAPTDGIVIHANEFSRGGNSEVMITAGTIVRERQTIIRLPDPKRMQVRAKVNESRITLIETGMPAKIRVDALSGMELVGRVARVNRYAEPGNWFSSNVKEYAAIIEIVDPPEAIRTGMTAEVQVFVQQLKDALQVPIQAIYEHNGKTYSLVKMPNHEYQAREVVIGATNDTKATIVSGINDRETVVLNLRQNLSLLDLPDLDPSQDTFLARQAGTATPGDAADNGASSSERPAAGGRPAAAGSDAAPASSGENNSRPAEAQRPAPADGGTPLRPAATSPAASSSSAGQSAGVARSLAGG